MERKLTHYRVQGATVVVHDPKEFAEKGEDAYREIVFVAPNPERAEIIADTFNSMGLEHASSPFLQAGEVSGAR